MSRYCTQRPPRTSQVQTARASLRLAGARKDKLRVCLAWRRCSAVPLHRVQWHVSPHPLTFFLTTAQRSCAPAAAHAPSCAQHSVFTVRTEPSVPPGSVGLNGMQRRVRATALLVSRIHACSVGLVSPAWPPSHARFWTAYCQHCSMQAVCPPSLHAPCPRRSCHTANQIM